MLNYFYLKGNKIYVAVIGFEETRWTETYHTGSGKNRRSHTRHCKGYNNFYNHKIPLY